CRNQNTNLPRPDEFRTHADSDRMMFIYTRVKEKLPEEKGVEKRPDLSKTQPQPDVKTDLQSLHGAWTLVEMETRGKKLTGKDMIYPFDSGNFALKSLKLVIDTQNIPKRSKIPADQVKDANDRLGGVEIHFSGSQPEKGEFLLNETKKPKRIAMSWFVMYWESIYKLDGDTLTLCFNPRTCIRPDEFRTPADSDQVIYVFKREKPAQEKKGQGVDTRPDLSGTQVAPETKKPDPAPKKTDPSASDVRILKGHSAAVYFAAFSPNGETLVTAAKGITKTPRADELIIWDVTAQKAKHKIQFQAPAHIWSMTLSADG